MVTLNHWATLDPRLSHDEESTIDEVLLVFPKALFHVILLATRLQFHCCFSCGTDISP